MASRGRVGRDIPAEDGILRRLQKCIMHDRTSSKHG